MIPFAWMLVVLMVLYGCLVAHQPLPAFVMVLVAIASGLAMSADSRRFFPALFCSAMGVVLPFLAFAFSLWVPAWKGGCKYGWVDCFAQGKLVLLPLVIWACAAFHVTQVAKPAQKPGAWVDAGLLIGTVASVVCLCVGGLILSTRNGILLFFPFCTSIWYGALTIRAMFTSGTGLVAYFGALVGSAPLWIVSVLWSKEIYRSLPNHPPPGCFVVTATLQGHESVIGPLCEVTRNGRQRVASQQLLAFWEFEMLWQSCSPETHRMFRRFYNQAGPHLARRINTPLKADAVWYVLKPFEVMAMVFARFGYACRARQMMVLGG